MNGRQRITKILTGQPVDRPPFVPVLSLYGARLSAQDSEAYYTDAAAYAVGQSAVMDLVAPDVLFAPFVLSAEGAAFGGEEVFLPRHPPNIKAFAVRGPSDLAHLRPPPPVTHPRLRYVLDAVSRLRDQLGDRAMICAICIAPVDLPAIIMGIDAWLQTFMFDEKGRDAVLDVTTSFFVTWANALFAAGADLIGLPVAFANASLVTRWQAELLIEPVLRRAFASVKGPLVFHHAGGTLGPFVSLYKHLPNVAGFAMDAGDSLSQARRDLGPDKILLGNLNGPTLATLTPSQAAEQSRQILQEREGDPMFFFGTSAADIPWDTQPATLLAIRDTVEAGDARTPAPSTTPPTTLIACSIFRPFIESMDWEAPIPPRVLYLDSALHVVPEDLDALLESIINYERHRGRLVLVAYGDCTSHLVERCRQPGVRRLPVVNCCAALVGHERYHHLRKGEVFAFLPEWTGRWRPVLQKAFGGDEATLRAIFRATNRGIVFLESEQMQVPKSARREIVDFFALPSTTLSVSGEHLQTELRTALHALQGERSS
jgi:uroporphyrinogen decarboxylase